MKIHRTNSRTSLLIYGIDGRVKHRLYLGPAGVIADESAFIRALGKLALRTDFVELDLTDPLEGRLPSGLYKSCSRAAPY